MPQIGPLEILVVGFIALLVFGPEKLPEIARSIGKGINQMKKMASDVKSEFDMNLADDEQASTEPPAASTNVTTTNGQTSRSADVAAPAETATAQREETSEIAISR